METFDHRRGVYPLALSVAIANWRVLLVAALILTLNRLGATVTQMELPSDSPETFAAWGLEVLVDLLVTVAIDFTIIPCLLSLGTLRDWPALSRARAGPIGLYIGLSLLFGVIVMVPVVLVGILAVAFVSPEEDPFAYVAILGIAVLILLVLLSALIGLAFPDVVASGRLSVGRAWGWGRANFSRLNYLLWTGVAPVTLLVLFLDDVFDTGVATGEAEPPEVLGLTTFLDGGLVGLVGVVATVLTTTALCKVYYVVAPPDEQLQNERVAEVFD